MKIIAKTHFSNKFSWKENHGTANILNFSEEPWGRVFDDSAEVGFVVKNIQTGTLKFFAYSKNIKNKLDQFIATEFVSVDKKQKIVIFLD